MEINKKKIPLVINLCNVIQVSHNKKGANRKRIEKRVKKQLH